MGPRDLIRKAYNAVAHPRRAAMLLQLEADCLRLRLGPSRALRAAHPRRPPSGTALIVSLSDQVYQLKLEGVIAKALQLEGYRPVVLTLRDRPLAYRYLRAFGVEDFVFPDVLRDSEAARAATAAASNALRDNPGVQELKHLEYRGAKVGQAALSSLSRHLQRGRISLDDADARELLPKLLEESMQAVHVAEDLLDRERPEIVVFNEKGYAGYGSIYDVALARGANVIQFVAAGIHWRDALLFKRYTVETRSVHPASLSERSWELVRAMAWDDVREAELRHEFELRYGEGEKHPDAGLQEGKRIKTPAEIQAQLGLDPEKPTVVLFSHVLWDANLFYGTDLFEDQEQWLVETVKAACANPNANWIVKLHPANMYKAHGGELNDEEAIRSAVGELPSHVKLLRPETDINTYALFALADAGITIRGTIGMELPCFGVPILTAGTGRYSGLGFTDDSATREEYLDKLARIHELPPLSEEQTLLAKRHAYGLFRLRPLRFTTYSAHFMPADRLGHALSHNLELTVRTPEEVETAPDLREFGEWARGDELDYLSLG